MRRKEIFLIIVVVLAGLSSVGVLFSTSYAEKPVYQLWLEDYPFYIEAGENIEFKLSLLAENNPVTKHRLDVYLDDRLVEVELLTVMPDTKYDFYFTIQTEDENKYHEIRVEFYDVGIEAGRHGSASSPYYLFFKVDAV